MSSTRVIQILTFIIHCIVHPFNLPGETWKVYPARQCIYSNFFTQKGSTCSLWCCAGTTPSTWRIRPLISSVPALCTDPCPLHILPSLPPYPTLCPPIKPKADHTSTLFSLLAPATLVGVFVPAHTMPPSSLAHSQPLTLSIIAPLVASTTKFPVSRIKAAMVHQEKRETILS
jgi:hypothetical protein